MTEPPALPVILARRVVYRRYLTLAKLTLRLPGGVIVSRDVEYHGDAAAVFPYDPARRKAREELGISLPPLDFVARIWPSPGVSAY